jgi:hypothetical protein
VKTRDTGTSHKKVVIQTFEGEPIRGYVNPARLGMDETVDLLTVDGEHQAVPQRGIKGIYFVREFTDHFEPERKAFLSRPKLDGLWVRLKFRDGDVLEGVVANNLLSLLDHGVQITPPDLHGQTPRIFIPRSAILEMTVLGVVGVARRGARRAAAAVAGQPTLFNE